MTELVGEGGLTFPIIQVECDCVQQCPDCPTYAQTYVCICWAPLSLFDPATRHVDWIRILLLRQLQPRISISTVLSTLIQKWRNVLPWKYLIILGLVPSTQIFMDINLDTPLMVVT